MDQPDKKLPSRPLNEEQKTYVLIRLAKNWEYEDIKDGFQRFFETGIDGETIIQLEIKHQSYIEQIKPQVLDPKKHRLAHAANRLEILDDALRDAMTLRPIGPPIRTGPDTWEPGEKGMNVSGMVAISKEARSEEYMAKKFYLEVVKLRLEKEKETIIGSGFTQMEVNTGIEEDEKVTSD